MLTAESDHWVKVALLDKLVSISCLHDNCVKTTTDCLVGSSDPDSWLASVVHGIMDVVKYDRISLVQKFQSKVNSMSFDFKSMVNSSTFHGHTIVLCWEMSGLG